MKPFTDHFSLIRKTIALYLLVAFVFTNVVAVRTLAATLSNESTAYTTDLTQLGREGRLRQSSNFENEISQVLEVLEKGGKQPVIVDQDGSVQDEMVEQIAIRIAKGTVPVGLKNRSLIKLETTSLYSAASDSAKLQAAVQDLLEKVLASNGQTILFVEDVPTFVNAKTEKSAFVSALRDGGIRIIGGSSKAAYEEKIASSGTRADLFEVVSVESKAKTSDDDAMPRRERSYRGDNVSPDLRAMMQENGDTKRVDVIVQAKDAENASLRALIESGKATIVERIGRTDNLLVNMPLSTVETLSKSGLVNYISPNREVKMLGHLENTTGTSQMRWQPNGFGRSGYTLDGAGVGIAVIDSGIASNLKSFTDGTSSSRVVYSKSFIAGDSSTNDAYGHGTHVASIAAGSSSRNGGAYHGIAPKANIINLRVLDQNGTGTTSSLLNAIEWIRVNHRTYNIRVVNISLGTPAIDSMWNDPLCYAVEDLNYYGILVVAAAGNNGKSSSGSKIYGKIHSPGNDPSVLTVGATNTFGTDSRSDDSIASYSSHGPTRSYWTDSSGYKHYDNVIKPDIVAPGNKIVAAAAPSNKLIAEDSALTNSTLDISGTDNDMMYQSGTSMATPVASGAAALLFQMNPKLTPTMVKIILQYTAQPLSGVNMYEQGTGQLNVDGAVRLARGYKFETDFNSVSKGAWLFQPSQSLPSASSTISGATFPWAQGAFSNHAYLRGTALVTNYHDVYDNWWWPEWGVSYGSNNAQSLNSCSRPV